jgi:hypothetical protein
VKTPPISQEALAALAGGVANIVVDIVRVNLDAVVGYRAQCEAAGFSPTAAEAMAEEFHRHLLAMLFSSIGSAPK